MEKLTYLIKKYGQFIRYVVVGCMTTLVSLLTYYLCVCTFLDPLDPLQLQIANIISWICAVLFAYVTNRKYVFESRSENRLQEAGKFFSARITTLLIDMGCMALFVQALHWNDKLSKLLVQVIVFVLNYVFSKLFVFVKKTEEA